MYSFERSGGSRTFCRKAQYSQLSRKLQKLQNRAARKIVECSYETPSSILLEELNWHKLHTTRKKHKAILMYKTLNGN